MKDCVLKDRMCTNCGQCLDCDITPKKVCDNCCQCIELSDDYKGILIDDILSDIKTVKKVKPEI